MRWWRDWRRGYGDADVATARDRLEKLPPLRGTKPASVTLRLRKREWRAFFGERMTIPGNLPPVLFEIQEQWEARRP